MRSLLFNLTFYLFTAVVALTCLPLMLIPGRRVLARVLYRWSQGVLWLMKRVLGVDLTIAGRERLPRSGSYIIAGKHHSECDAIIVCAVVPDITFVAMKELLDYPVVGWVLRKLRMIMVDTCGGHTQRDLVNEGARKVAQSGRPILIYPEGQLVKPYEKAEYKKSIFHMYEALGVPVVPVGTSIGLRWEMRSWTKHGGPATLEFLEPIQPGVDKETFMARLESMMETRSNELLDRDGGVRPAGTATANPVAAA